MTKFSHKGVQFVIVARGDGKASVMFTGFDSHERLIGKKVFKIRAEDWFGEIESIAAEAKRRNAAESRRAVAKWFHAPAVNSGMRDQL